MLNSTLRNKPATHQHKNYNKNNSMILSLKVKVKCQINLTRFLKYTICEIIRTKEI